MTGHERIPALARGVRFRRLEDGRGVLLVPEGVVNLSPTAAAAAELFDGTRSEHAIVVELRGRFSAPATVIADDVSNLLDRLARSGWVFFSSREAGA